MKVRRATTSDAAAVAALWTEAYSDDLRGGRMTPYACAEVQAAAEAGEVLVAEDDFGLAGVVVLYEGGVRKGQFARSGEVELSRLAVAKRHRRQGLGKQLVQTCLTAANQQGARALVLWSQRHQTEAHDLYKSLGFGRAPDRDEEGWEGLRLVFIRRL
jgi:ribosomal protein S18 acetylase RimI-like enzyme